MEDWRPHAKGNHQRIRLKEEHSIETDAEGKHSMAGDGPV